MDTRYYGQILSLHSAHTPSSRVAGDRGEGVEVERGNHHQVLQRRQSGYTGIPDSILIASQELHGVGKVV